MPPLAGKPMSRVRPAATAVPEEVENGDKPPTPPTANNAYDADEHLLAPLEAAARFGTHVDPQHPDGASHGLNSEQVLSLRAKYGRNALTPPKTTPEALKVLRQFANPLLLMLLLACALTFLVYGIQSPRERDNLILASVMAVVVVVLALTSYWQERSAGNVMGASLLFFSRGCRRRSSFVPSSSSLNPKQPPKPTPRNNNNKNKPPSSR
jgi:magnesium-transporting ATPase (P-type)